MNISCFDATHYSHKYMFSSWTDFKYLAFSLKYPLCQSYSLEEQETITPSIPRWELHTKGTSALGFHYFFGSSPIRFK